MFRGRYAYCVVNIDSIFLFNTLIDELRRTYKNFYTTIEDEIKLPPPAYGLVLEYRRHIQMDPAYFERVLRGFKERHLISLTPFMSQEQGLKYAKKTLDLIKERGTEAIAVYLPYHLSRSWGIYIFEEPLNGLSYIISHYTGLAFDYVFNLCERAVIEHELFHFQTEYAATIAETVCRKPIYGPYFVRSRPYSEDEEAIANACMLTLSHLDAKIRSMLEMVCLESPPGYKDFRKFLRRGVWELDYLKIR